MKNSPIFSVVVDEVEQLSLFEFDKNITKSFAQE